MGYELIYVNRLGYNYRGDATYEFIFADDTVHLEDVWGEGWIERPADGRAQPPEIECISKVGVLKCKDYDLGVTNDSIEFGLCDAKDGIVALAWEAIDEEFDPKKQRLVFKFGDELGAIEKLLKKRKLEMTYEN